MADNTQTFEYTNETFSGCDMVAAITIRNPSDNTKQYTKVLGEIQTISYSIHMEKRPIRSIGNVNVKDYVIGPRTIAGSLVFSVFNKHFSQDLIENINESSKAGALYLVDELPPFDLIISAANEYGYRSSLVIYGIRLLNEGQVMSINDVFTENTYQFFATDLEYLTDQMSYARSKEDNKYKLTDTVVYDMPDPPVYKHNAVQYFTSKEQQAYLDKISNAAIKITCATKQPTRSNNKGIVDFFINPAQSGGTIYVENSTNEITEIKIKAIESKDRKSTIDYASSVFFPDTYTAYFINDLGKESNHIKFNIVMYTKSNNQVTSTPIIDSITSKSVTIFSDNPKHNKLLLSSLSNNDIKTFDIKNKKVKIINLDENTTYNVRTYSSVDNDSSKTISFTTLYDYKQYTELISYLKANKTNLSITNIEDYINLINENKVIDLSPVNSILKAKSKYKNDLSILDLSSSNYKEDKKELEAKILLCSEILNIAIKMNNDLISAINKELNVPAPIISIDNNYDNIFQFDENITSAEFFRVYDNIEQYATTVNSYNFKNINNKINSYRFLGKPGVKHYVQAIINNVRSTKVEFYVMTEEEKQVYITKDTSKTKVSNKEVLKLNNVVNNDLDNTISAANQRRAFMTKIKKINNYIIPVPEIISINEEVIVNTFIDNLTYSKDTYYLAVATYEDIINNKDIYKVPFSSLDKDIIISPLYNGIKKDKEYAVWIENSNYIQISNAATFIYSPETDPIDYISEYELKDIKDYIVQIANADLTTNIKELIESTIKNNEEMSSTKIISSAINIVTTNSLSKTNILNFLYSMKKYIGIYLDSTASFITNLEYNTNIISFNSYNNGTILIYDSDEIKQLELQNNNNISLNDFNNNILVIVIVNEDLSKKSNVLVINKNEKYMEVL